MTCTANVNGVVLTFGKKFQELRQRHGLTQKEVAAALRLSDDSAVAVIERRTTVPKADTIKRYASDLGWPAWEFLEGVQTPHDKIRLLKPTVNRKEGSTARATAKFG